MKWLVASILCFALAVEHVVAEQPDKLDSHIRDADLSRLPQETSAAYTARMTRLVAEKSYICPETVTGFSLIERAGAALAPDQLFVHGILLRDRFNCGYCAAKAHVLKTILAEHGVASSVYFTQHVILRSEGRYFDPTFGVGPFQLSEYKAVYRDIPKLAPTVSWDYVFHHPSGPPEMQGRWNAVMEMEEQMQRIFFLLADAIAGFLALLGCLFLSLVPKWRSSRERGTVQAARSTA